MPDDHALALQRCSAQVDATQKKAEGLRRRSYAGHVQAHLIDAESPLCVPDAAPAQIQSVAARLRSQSAADLRAANKLSRSMPHLQQDADAASNAASAHKLLSVGAAEMDELQRGGTCCAEGLIAAEELDALVCKEQSLLDEVCFNASQDVTPDPEHTHCTPCPIALWCLDEEAMNDKAGQSDRSDLLSMWWKAAMLLCWHAGRGSWQENGSD